MKLLLLTAIVLLSTAASANPFAKVKLGQPVCYGREYSREHMKNHPKQTVRQMKVKGSKEEWSGDTILLEVDAEIRREVKDSYSGEIIEVYRPYGTSLGCSHSANKLECSIDCDGGTAQITWSVKGNKDQIQLINQGFIMYGGCGEETDETIFLNAIKGGDDIFKLFALPKEYCQQ